LQRFEIGGRGGGQVTIFCLMGHTTSVAIRAER
jgi:hypothetical protein